MRRRSDQNQIVVTKALRAAGALVQPLSDVGKGVPDLLVGFNGKLHLLEVKNMEGRGDGLTPAERVFHDKWAGYPVHIVRNAIEAFEAVGVAWEA